MNYDNGYVPPMPEPDIPGQYDFNPSVTAPIDPMAMPQGEAAASGFSGYSNQYQNEGVERSATLGSPIDYPPVSSGPKSPATISGSDDSAAGLRYKSERQGEIFVKKAKSRWVHLPTQQDDELFDEILRHHNSNVGKSTYFTLLEMFGGRPHGDALVKCVVGAPFYDYVLKYPVETKHEDHVGKREAFLHHLLQAHVYLDFEASRDRKFVYVKLIMPFEVLLGQAEKMKFKYPIKHDVEAGGEESPIVPGMEWLVPTEEDTKPMSYFRKDKLHCFEEGDLPLAQVQQNFFSSRRRILMTYYYVTSIKLSATKKHKHVGVRLLLNQGVFSEFYPLHDGSWKPDESNKNDRARLMRSWANKWISKQPLDDINDYFGEKVALYFAWLGTYTFFLGIAAFAGVLATFGGLYVLSDPSLSKLNALDKFFFVFDSPPTTAFAIFMSIWSTCFLEYWKRRQYTLTYRWNVLEFSKEEVNRPEFKPTAVRKSPITGVWERYEPTYKAKSKFFISVLVSLSCIMIVLLSVGFNTWLRITSSGKNQSQSEELWTTIGVSVEAVVVIVVLGMAYNVIAIKINNWENHATESSYDDGYVGKKFLFDFVNSYSALLYLGLLKTPLIEYLNVQEKCSSTECSPDFPQCQRTSCMSDLTLQLAITFVGKQLVGQLIEVATPFFQKKWAQYTEKKAMEKQDDVEALVAESEVGLSDIARENVPQFIKDDSLNKNDGTAGEYLEMVLQYGFVTLFASSFPLGALAAWINNMNEIRSDAAKLLREMQRPIPYQAANIGAWYGILSAVSYVAVFTNAALIAFTSKSFYNNFLVDPKTTVQLPASERLLRQVLFVIAFEHVAIAFKLILAYAIPDVPQKVANAMKREEYIADVTIEGEPPAEDDPEALMMIEQNPEKYAGLKQRHVKKTADL